uniref:EH domain-containing protein n=1 Tax=Chromera velia CCMP2878 TaxID=1169474 RepID=A0A0G4HGH0_9ALVE|mmetsp:Transcript_49588/g.97681  ORF Transcript_49588/g.97681 Transcript_49588/m.97681 type:complete len:553 (+) Transcript_49588:249-1907(+)|eukprot:Cvel_6712.t1-p1 / transcript=Cvel_6712.t1 / gene=Cvel_6712 / organism=Chromera_velia_CCMP2878 / gene_product=EH domain-containing protein 1, putative / transcript_product=EH domain-containing protein 1, putative / location=Cvel_scaffold335:33634-38197(+) / protein_length=552 / sequence_SO=supercontig / SO=protein_coding / is_pseudo=false
MLRWLNDKERGGRVNPGEVFDNITVGLQRLYKQRLLPLEKDYKFNQYYSPLLTDGDFASKPMVMLIGQYSTGKTTFIQHLLEREYPGSRIGPEPTTDRFCAVMHGEKEQVIPGNAAVVDPKKPFARLSDFGNTFLSRFEVAMCPSPVLQGITLIDTPGVLSGNKQTSRGYDFEGVIQWFGDRVDLILLMFDAHKLDISDEFRRAIGCLKGNDNKIRILLNKADMVSTQQLLRVYGALMWSLGKVIPTPEVARVYIGSFWDHQLHNDEMRRLFEAEANDLYSDIQQLPRNAAIRKLNDFIKRSRLARVHARILDHCRAQMGFFGKSAKQRKLLDGMQGVFQKVSAETSTPPGDFPPIQLFVEKTEQCNVQFEKVPKLDQKRLDALEETLAKHIPALLELVPREESRMEAAAEQTGTTLNATVTPFMAMKMSSSKDPEGKRLLSQPPDGRKYEADFEALGPDADGLISGLQAKEDLTKSKLPSSVLHRIWNLSDVTKDGCLDLFEYALCRHFIQMKLDGYELPADLPPSMYPPGFVPEGSREDELGESVEINGM